MGHESGFAALAVVSACVIVWGLVSGRLERWDVSAPIAFVVLGVVVTHGPTALVHFTLHSSTIRSFAEVTLAIVLFADASRVNLRALRADAVIPARLLAIGLPLTIAAGAATAALLFGSSGLWVAAAIGAIVAPTDAALGASIMSDLRVPSGVRRTLNVESGLNDGIATPFVNLFIAGAVTADAVAGQHLWAAIGALVGGTGLGIGIGVVGAALLALARRHQWSSPAFRPLAILALAVFAYSAAYVAGLNGFVCAFVAGLAFGSVDHHNDEAVLGFAEEAGTLMSLLVWFIFGAAMLVPGLEHAGWRDLVFALLALTVLRMVPVAVALAGTGLDRATDRVRGMVRPARPRLGRLRSPRRRRLRARAVQRGAGGSHVDRRIERAAARRQRVAPGGAVRGLRRGTARARPPGARQARGGRADRDEEPAPRRLARDASRPGAGRAGTGLTN